MATPGDYVQAGPDTCEGQIDLASLPHPPIEEENADPGNCMIPSNSSRIAAGDSVYVKERDCEELRAEMIILRNRVEAAEQQAKEKVEESHKICKKIDELTKEKAEFFQNVEELSKKAGDLEKLLIEKEDCFERQLSQKEQDFENRLTEKENGLEKQLVEKLAENKKEFEQQLSSKEAEHHKQQAQKDEEVRETTRKLETCRKQLEEYQKQLIGAGEKEELLVSIIADLKKQVEVLIDENKDLENTIADLRKHVNSLNQQMGELKDKVREKCVQKEDFEKMKEEMDHNKEEQIKTRGTLDRLLKQLEPVLSGNITTIGKFSVFEKTVKPKPSSTSSTPPSNRSKTPTPPPENQTL